VRRPNHFDANERRPKARVIDGRKYLRVEPLNIDGEIYRSDSTNALNNFVKGIYSMLYFLKRIAWPSAIY